MARRNTDSYRQIVVSVVGISGGEREKGVTGIGKSCFCNRFIRPQADNYHVDHISVLSQTDFSGRVVNNDHFLYWGEAVRGSDDGTDYNFHVIEQTEFIDDASFTPFKAGKMDPYIKRCCAPKIQSAEKLMYICKNQLGIEKEYEQRILPEGKLNVDGFICVFDVSQVPNRSLDRMVEMTAAILTNCVKTKRPVVLVTTKNDEANEVYVKEAEKLCCRKEFKGNIPLVETSSHECVNVDLAFLTVAQLVDRNRGKIRIVPFFEAARHRKDILDMATDIYHRLLRNVITDYHTPWAIASKQLTTHSDFGYYVDLFGIDSAARLYRRHAKKLKDEFLQRKLQGYMDLLPTVLRDFFPEIQTLQEADWDVIRSSIEMHPDFDRFLLRTDGDIPWAEDPDLLVSTDPRIPLDALDTAEAETVFKNYLNTLQAEQEMREMRDQFKALLNETGYVTPGKRLDEVRVLFMGRESFDALSEHDRQLIYDQHQTEITERSRRNFVELLLEHAELFDHVKSLVPSGTITPEDIREITMTLQEDGRYKVLDRMDSERNLLLLQHLSFIHYPKKELCPAFPSCVDALVERIVAQRKLNNSRPGSGSWSGKGVEFSDLVDATNQVKLAFLGMQGLGQELFDVAKYACEDDELEMNGLVFALSYRVIDSDAADQQTILSEFEPNGIVCAYSNQDTLSYLRESLERALLTQLEKKDVSSHLPIAILFAPGSDVNPTAIDTLQESGAALAESLQCSFIGASPSRKLDFSLVSTALRSIVAAIHHRNHPQGPLSHSPGTLPDSQPDIRIIMCVLCGDPYSIDNVLSPLLSQQGAAVSGERAITLHAYLDEWKRRIEVIVSSYHGVEAFRDDLVHGFVLAYSTKRKASLATLRAFSSNVTNLPIQIVAVTDSTSATAFFSSDVSQQLMTEGNNIADRLQARFMTLGSPQQSAMFMPFFREVWEKKLEIEHAWSMEDPSGLDDSGEGTLERPRPPFLKGSAGLRGGPGFAAFMRRNVPDRSRSVEGSSSEIYETVPTDGSVGDGLDVPPSPPFLGSEPAITPSDDSDVYSHFDNDEAERLVKPSRFKRTPSRFTQADGGGSRDSLITRDSGWVEDSLTTRRMEEFWADSNYGPHSFTMGRRPKLPPPPIRPKPPKTSQTLKQPGKLNLRDYSNVTDAIGRLSMKECPPVKLTKGDPQHAPLATPENIDLGASEYATVKDAVPLRYFDASEFGYSRVPEVSAAASAKARQRQRRERGRQAYSDSDSDWSSLERRRSSDSSRGTRKGVQRRNKKKRTPIPVATPKVPLIPASSLGQGKPSHAGPAIYSGDGSLDSRFTDDRLLLNPSETKGSIKAEGEAYYRILADEDSSVEVSSPRDPPSPLLPSAKKDDKTAKRREKQRSKEEARIKEEEKKRLKEEEKLRKEKEREKKKALKGGSKGSGGGIGGKSKDGEASLDAFAQGPTKPVPLFVEKCVSLIESEGLDSEGIYRVPGNKVHVEQLFARFKEDRTVSFAELDIPVNAAATALKDYLKQLPPLLPQSKMEQLTSIASFGDRSCRLLKLKEMLTNLPQVNFEVLKFIFQHFVRVAENCKLNSMDSKNLAICWWPTLLHTLQFSDISAFESQRPHIEDIIQTMIDQFPFLFQGKEDYVMV